jgi:hypothetical protein
MDENRLVAAMRSVAFGDDGTQCPVKVSGYRGRSLAAAKTQLPNLQVAYRQLPPFAYCLVAAFKPLRERVARPDRGRAGPPRSTVRPAGCYGPRAPPNSRSSKQLPTNQRDTDKAKKHEPNEIHPEYYGVYATDDQSIAASTK